MNMKCLAGAMTVSLILVFSSCIAVPSVVPSATPSAAPVTPSGSVSESVFSWDSRAQIDTSLQGSRMGPYLVTFNNVYPLVYFSNPDRPVVTYATYNYEYQYWEFKNSSFDASAVDLKRLFLRIDLSKTSLDRMKPESRTMAGASASSTYDWRSDIDFSRFVAWMRQGKVPESTVDFYIAAASHPGKRGAALPWGVLYTDAEVGLQAENMKPISFKTVYDGAKFPKDRMLSVGGMQYYFEQRKGAYIKNANAAYSLFRDNRVVPVTIVEILPSDGRKIPPASLQGDALVSRVSNDLTAFFGGSKTFRVRRVSLPVDYSSIEGRQNSLYEMDQFMDRWVHDNLPKDRSLYIYYFTDTDALRKMDRSMSHPLTMGAYGGDWARNYRTILHEFGHALGMRHHFDTETEGANDLDRHCSPACVMNYRFTKDGFCELCLYSLGL